VRYGIAEILPGGAAVIAANYSLWLIAASGLALIWFDKRVQKKSRLAFGFQPGLGLERLPRFLLSKTLLSFNAPFLGLAGCCAVSGLRRLWNESHRPSQLVIGRLGLRFS